MQRGEEWVWLAVAAAGLALVLTKREGFEGAGAGAEWSQVLDLGGALISQLPEVQLLELAPVVYSSGGSGALGALEERAYDYAGEDRFDGAHVRLVEMM